MKVRDCQKCRKELLKQAETQYLEHSFEIFENTVDSATTFAICGVLMCMYRRGESKEYIHDLFEELCMIFSVSEVFGKKITMEDMMAMFSKEYDIDWDKVEVNYEDKKAFMRRYRKGE